ncbi:uncharacterized protein FOMMEDRAFT_157328 [Fomitiporia mediterranea MF3/22]|uniref:uncharacterized protein n=1 Tax=Fomitiporia mediterranea (strain MF3/22) TaxID=694068 RepID=UPI0004407D59|nr:uncharacterized protein FOMMEDRAFT_157328 [Fomitiporia mediterranea MF3/22]EJD02137.1 hypothetical protein FOMMEDRAFT_157328 [Fomitiporia mediterranea MF3/22]
MACLSGSLVVAIAVTDRSLYIVGHSRLQPLDIYIFVFYTGFNRGLEALDWRYSFGTCLPLTRFRDQSAHCNRRDIRPALADDLLPPSCSPSSISSVWSSDIFSRRQVLSVGDNLTATSNKQLVRKA